MMVEDWVVDFAEELKEQLQSDWSEENIEEVVKRLSNAVLTAEQEDFVWQYFRANGYDKRTGMFMLCESDNSAFLKVVAQVKAKVGGK